MRKIARLLSTVALSAALCAGIAGTALADVSYQDREVVVTGSGSYTATDLFDGFKGVMPGDELDQSVTVGNDSGKKVKVYLRAEAHDEASNPLTYDEAYEAADGRDQSGIEGSRDETVATMSDFLAQLHMTVAVGGEVVFEGSCDEEDGLADNVLLGELEPGAGLEIDVALSVPIELGDEYAYRVGEVDWVFTIEEIDSPLPTTGDAAPLALIGALVACAAVALAASRLSARRHRG